MFLWQLSLVMWKIIVKIFMLNFFVCQCPHSLHLSAPGPTKEATRVVSRPWGKAWPHTVTGGTNVAAQTCHCWCRTGAKICHSWYHIDAHKPHTVTGGPPVTGAQNCHWWDLTGAQISQLMPPCQTPHNHSYFDIICSVCNFQDSHVWRCMC